MELQDKACSREVNGFSDLPQNSQKAPKKQPTRKNPWGNRSYADLITQAIQNAPEQRLTLSQIYDWMVKNIPHFKDKGENNSSAGWKNSIRHNLSLHTRFVRVQNDVTGKSSWWIIDPEGGDGRVTRRRSLAKGDRTRTCRRQRSKPKPGTKCRPPQDQAFVSSSFSRPAPLSGNYTVTAPRYFPRDPSWQSECGQRQRWHSSSSSSCSSEEITFDPNRIFRTLSPGFQQPRSPLSDRNSSGFSSPSSESDPGDGASSGSGHPGMFATFQDGVSIWVTSPESSIEPSQLLTSTGTQWDSRYQWETRDFLKKNDWTFLSNQLNEYPYCGLPSPNNYFCTSQTCSPELQSDSDDRPSPSLDVSSQYTIAMIDFYGHPHQCETNSVSAYSLSCSGPGQPSCLAENSLYRSPGNWFLNPLEVLGDDVVPSDLHTCHVLPGIECNVSDVITHEIEMEGQLMFLDCFVDPGWSS